MSAESRARMEDAIRAHVADESDGGLCTAWVLAAVNVEPADPGVVGYTFWNSATPRHEIVGLLSMAHTEISSEQP